MSDISNSCSITSSSKRRLGQIDDALEYLTQDVNNINNFAFKTEFECSLMTVKIKREKVKALSALARSQVILTDMEIMMAESDLYTDIERLKNFKRLKLEHEEGQPQNDAPQEKDIQSVQTTKSKSNKKKRTHSSSRKSPEAIYTDETVMLPTTHKSSASFVDTSQNSKASCSLDLFENSPANKSDSEISLSNSIKAAFNEPYINTREMQEPIKKSPKKKNKSEKAHSKSTPKKVTKRTESPTDRLKTVADLKTGVSSPSNAANNNRISQRKTTGSHTFVPIRHNLPAILSPPSTLNGSPILYITPAPQTSVQYETHKADNNQAFTFYSGNQ